MADNKKYYYMRLKENFFETEEMVMLEAMPDGIYYSNILIKLYLKSLKNDGRLMFKDTIPYNPQMIATITRHQVGTVEKGLQIFEQLGLIDVLDDGAIYMNDIELFVGQASTEAERKKKARLAIEQEKKARLAIQQERKIELGQMSDKCPTDDHHSIKLEKDIELDKEKDILPVQQAEKDYVNKIFDYYNSKGIIKHSKLTKIMEKEIKNRLKEYDFDQLIQVVDNYNAVYRGDQYYFDTKYTLAELMREKDVAKFIDESEPLTKMLRFDRKKSVFNKDEKVLTAEEQALKDLLNF